jgi:glyoxylase-like metal-dependent hydrolase (beta-lactamase superfamily II)
MPINRREFLAQSGSCAGHLALAASFMPAAARAAWGRSPTAAVVAREPFGSLERVADGVWALISTPLAGDRTTVSNGGIIAGRNGVLAIEGLQTPAGATWLAGKARELTGKWPTHVIVTHYHGDHANGLTGYFSSADKPALRSTARTRDLVIEKKQPADASRAAAIKDAIMISATEPSTLDLGGRVVRLVPRAGHTDSDVSLELEDPSLVFGGDLFWNGMFPNFVDAVPTKLAASVREMRRAKDTIYVPGHGAVGRAPEYDRYIAMLGEVEQAARKAHAAGTSATDAGAAFSLPASLGEWALFNRAFFGRAFEAWYKELK